LIPVGWDVALVCCQTAAVGLQVGQPVSARDQGKGTPACDPRGMEHSSQLWEGLPWSRNPDVVLLDLGLENGDSLRVAREVLKEFPGARVIVMDLLPAHEELREFVNAGVSGFIMKDAHFEAVLGTIRAVAAGLKVLPDQMTATLFSEIAKEVVTSGGSHDHESVRMTPREREVIELIAEGMSNKAIGKELHISVHTVKSHLRNIMEKLALNSRLQIAAHIHNRRAAESE